MATDTKAHFAMITEPFGDGDHTFCLDWPRMVELEKVREAGPLVILSRLSGPWMVEDISAVIRLGLIGGGCTPVEALRLTKTYVEGRPLLENLSLAYKCLAVAISGPLPPAEEAAPATGNGAPEAETSGKSPEEAGNGAPKGN